jgi:uncharacterized protein YdaT
MSKLPKVANTVDKLEKYRKHLIEGKPISDKNKEYLEKMNFANTLLCEGYSRNKIIPVIQKRYELSQSMAYILLTHTIQLFGDVSKSSKNGKKHIVGENFLRLAKKAENEQKLDIAQYCYDRYAKLHGLYDNGFDMDLSSWMRPTKIIFTDNIEILKEQNIQDTNYIDVTDENEEDGGIY